MSLMIKGMKLPKGCDSCDLVRDYDEDSVCCPFLRSESWYGAAPDYRLEHCPIIGVLTPHGRLIDADELRKKLERHRDMCGDIETQYGIDTAIRILNNTPTIIEAEVSE